MWIKKVDAVSVNSSSKTTSIVWQLQGEHIHAYHKLQGDTQPMMTIFCGFESQDLEVHHQSDSFNQNQGSSPHEVFHSQGVRDGTALQQSQTTGTITPYLVIPLFISFESLKTPVLLHSTVIIMYYKHRIFNQPSSYQKKIIIVNDVRISIL